MYGPRPQCLTCKRFMSPLRLAGGDLADPPHCAAFPDGIPQAVLDNKVDHRDPVDGDRGVRWESNGEPYPEWALA